MIQFPRVVPGDPLSISATAFVAYSQCPEQAAARQRGFYGPPSKPAFIGGLAHTIFARHLSTGPVPDAELKQVCREEIGSGSLNYQLSDLRLKPSDLERVIEEVGGLYRRFQSFPTDGFTAAEVALSVEPADGVELRGSIDAVFDDPRWGTRLIDWKTGQLGEAELQLSFYALVWALERIELPGKVEAISVKTGERFESIPSWSEAAETARAVGAMVDALRAVGVGESLERSGGPWCRYCGILDDCPEGRAAVEVLSR
jgi:RecB family exonuclease